MPNESSKWLYSQLVNRNYNVGKNYEEFDSLLSNNEESRKWAFETARKEGLNVGKDIDEFSGLVVSKPEEPKPQTFAEKIRAKANAMMSDAQTVEPTQEAEPEVSKPWLQQVAEDAMAKQQDALRTKQRAQYALQYGIGGGAGFEGQGESAGMERTLTTAADEGKRTEKKVKALKGVMSDNPLDVDDEFSKASAKTVMTPDQKKAVEEADAMASYRHQQRLYDEELIRNLVGGVVDENWERGVEAVSGKGKVQFGVAGVVKSAKEGQDIVSPEQVYMELEDKLTSPEMQRVLQERADASGLDLMQYMSQVVMPIVDQSAHDKMLEKRIVKGSGNYILRAALQQSVMGKVAGLMMQSKGTRQLEAEAVNAYKANGWEKAGAFVGGILADGPVFGLAGGVGSFSGKLAGRRLANRFVAAGAERAMAEGIASRAMQKYGLEIGTRMAAGAGNFATYEAMASVADQLYFKGEVDLGEAAKSAAKGLFLGGTMGIAGFGTSRLKNFLNLVGEKTAIRFAPTELSANIGRFTGSTIGYGVDLTARSLAMAGVNYAYMNGIEGQDASFGDLFEDALRTNIGFDMVGAVKHIARTGREGIKAFSLALREPDARLTAEDLASLGYKGVDHYTALADIVKKATEAARAEELGEGEKAVFSGKALNDFLKTLSSSDVTQETRSKVIYLLTGTRMMEPMTMWSAMHEENGKFVVTDYASPETVNRRRIFGTKEEGIKYMQTRDAKESFVYSLRTMAENERLAHMAHISAASPIIAQALGLREAKDVAEVILKVEAGKPLTEGEKSLFRKIEGLVEQTPDLQDMLSQSNIFGLIQTVASQNGVSYRDIIDFLQKGDRFSLDIEKLRMKKPQLANALSDLREALAERGGYTARFEQAEAMRAANVFEDTREDEAFEAPMDETDAAAGAAYDEGAAVDPAASEEVVRTAATSRESLVAKGAEQYCEQLEEWARDYEGRAGVPREVKELLENITDDNLREELQNYYNDLVRVKGAEDAPLVAANEQVQQLVQMWMDNGMVDENGLMQEAMLLDKFTRQPMGVVYVKPGQNLDASIVYVMGDDGKLVFVNTTDLIVEPDPISVDEAASRSVLPQVTISPDAEPSGSTETGDGGTTPSPIPAQTPTPTPTPTGGEASVEPQVVGGETLQPTEQPAVTMLPNGLQIDNTTGDPVVTAETKPSSVAEYYLGKTELPANIVDELVGAKIAEAQTALDTASQAEEPKPTAAGVNDYITRHGEWEQNKRNANDSLNFWLEVQNEIAKQRAASQPQVFTEGDVPDVSMDTPAAARERGYIMQNGVRIDRNHIISPLATGKRVVVPFSTQEGGKANATYVLLPIQTVVPSHRNGQPVVEHFFASEGQPKSRTDAASVNAARAIAADMNESIIIGNSAYEGAPVINWNGEVIQGNNRQSALEILYTSNADGWGKYRDMVKEHAEELGFTPDQLADLPDGYALYRLADVSDEEAVRLGNFGREDLESGGIQQINPSTASELMRQSGRVGGFLKTLLNDPDGDTSINGLIKMNGVEALKEAHAMGAINDTQYANSVQDGKLTDMARIQLEQILNNLIVGEGSPQMKTAYGMLPEKMQDAIISIYGLDSNAERNSQLWPDVHAALELIGYANRSENFRKAKTPEEVSTALGLVMSMPEAFDTSRPQFTPLQKDLAVRIKGSKAKDFLDVMKAYYDAVRPRELNLFSNETSLTKDEAIKQIFGVSNERQIQQGDGELVPHSDTDRVRGGVLPGGSGSSGQGAGESGQAVDTPAGGRVAGELTLSGYTEGNPEELLHDPHAIVDVTNTSLLAQPVRTLDDLKRIFDTLNGDAALKSLFDKVFDTCSIIGLDKVNLSSTLGTGKSPIVAQHTLDPQGRGQNTASYAITLGKSGFSRRVDNQEKASDILHEMIHTVTVLAIDYKNGKLVRTFGNSVPDAVKQGLIDGATDLENIFAAIKDDPMFVGQYGIGKYTESGRWKTRKDASEMVAELSQREFREKLKQKDLWVKTVDAISKFFTHEVEGAEKSDALTETEKALEKCMDAWNGRYMAVEEPKVQGLMTMEEIDALGLDAVTANGAKKWVEMKNNDPNFESDYLEGLYEAALVARDAARQNAAPSKPAPASNEAAPARVGGVREEGNAPAEVSVPEPSKPQQAGMRSVEEETAAADAEIDDLLDQISQLSKTSESLIDTRNKIDRENKTDIEGFAEQFIDVRNAERDNNAQLSTLRMKLSVALGKSGYQLIRGGETDPSKWMETMKAKYGEALKKAFKWDDDAKVDKYLADVREYTVVPGEDGEIRTIADHLAVKSSENLPQDAQSSPERTNFVIEVQGRLREQLREALSESAAETLGIPSMPPARMNINTLRTLAEKNGWSIKNDVQMQEAVEQAIVAVAREVVLRNANDPRRAYNEIVKLYDIQPTISMRSSNRIALQQYSTPTPMSYMADLYAMRNNARSVLEPTAGNGMMLIGIDPSIVHVNEIDPERLSVLQQGGYARVTNQDGREPFAPKAYDAVVMNPPFGSSEAKMYGEYRISGLDPQIVVNALESMKDDGRAAIIIGGNNEYDDYGRLKGSYAPFLRYLYNNYNVRDIINMAGSLYQRQGTTFPTRMILIEGRRTNGVGSVPRLDKNTGELVTNWNQLYERIDNLLHNGTSRLGGNKEPIPSGESASNGGSTLSDNGVVRGGEPAVRGGDGTRGAAGVQGQESGRPDAVLPGQPGGRVQPTSGQDADTGRPIGVGSSVDADGGLRVPDAGSRGAGNAGEQGSSGMPYRGHSTRPDVDEREGSGLPSGERNGAVASEQGLNGESTMGSEGAPESARPRVTEPEKVSLDQERTTYPQRSGGKAIDGCIVPAGMAVHVAKALNALGDVDQMVMDELGYGSKDELYKAFYGPQIDAIAMAVNQLKKGSGMIIGDGTGMGKGRQASAIVRWAVRQGKTPIYITEKPKLFTDNRRDMIGIGSGELRPLVIGSKDVLDEKTGEIVFKVATDAELNEAIQELVLTGKLPSRYNYVLTTYSQIQGGTMEYTADSKKPRKLDTKSSSAISAARSAQRKRDFIESLLKDNYVILDESHNAAGDGGGSSFIQYCLPKTAGAVYLSATFAKRPDCLPLYALKTSMSDANIPADKMIAAIESGGAVLEEVLSETLVQNGQYIRRDRDKGNTKHEWVTLEDKEGQTRRLYDSTIELFNDIIDFQDAFIKPLVDSMNETGDDIVGQTRGTEDLGVHNTPFASRTFNTVRQLLLALKADNIADRVIESCRNDQRPVIALGNTMEGAVEDLLEEEVDSEAPDFAEVFRKGLDSIFSLQRKDPNNPKNSIVEYIPLSMLSPEGQVEYKRLQKKMDDAFIGLPLSPLDYIVHKLEDAGLHVGEYTGRKHKLLYNDDGSVRWTKRTAADRDQNMLVDGFNSGAIDVLIINESGSTGLSLHAHQDFPDTRQRVLFTVQPLLDISKYMQMLGRVDRLGQVISPILYDISAAIPAEQRLMMMMKNKLASLNANTTSNQKNSDTEVDVVDFLNKYGNQVVTQLLKDNTDLNEKLRDPLDLSGNDEETEKPKVAQNAASKVSSRVALLSVEDQELFYSEMANRYNEFVDRLKDEGEYDLEASTQPLKATTLSRSVFVEGKDNNSDNVFAQSSYLDVCEVDVLKRPMKSREVDSLMKSLTDGKSANEHKETIYSEFDEAKESDLAEALRKIAEQRKTAVEAIKATRPEKIRAKKPDITDAELNEIIDEEIRVKNEQFDAKEATTRKRIEGMYENAQNFVFNMPVGKGLNVATLTQKDATVNSPGILVGYRRTGKKMIPSSVYAVFALHDGRRKIEVPLSDKRNLQAILQGRANDFTARDLSLDNWDTNISNAARKTAYIVTNNLLQGYGAIPNQAGVITRYTDSEGNVKTGIVLPSNFDFTKLRPQKSIVTSKGPLQQGETIKTSEGDMELQIVRDGSQTFVAISVAGSKKKGGKYYLDDGLRKFVTDGDFNKRGGKMVGLTSTTNLDALLQYLDKKFHLTYSSDSDVDTRSKRVSDKTDDIAWAEDFVDTRNKEYGEEEEKEKQITSWVDDLNSRYKLAVSPVVVSTKMTAKELQEKAGIIEEEAREALENDEMVAGYAKKSKKIIIFADRIPLEAYSEVEHVAFHESLHEKLDEIFTKKAKEELLDRYWACNKYTPKLTETIKKAYEEEDWKEEYFVESIAIGMSNGTLKKRYDRFANEGGNTDRIDDVLNTIGYDREEESKRRAKEKSEGLQELGTGGNKGNAGSDERGRIGISDKTDDIAWAENFVDIRNKTSEELEEEYPGWNEGSVKDNGGDNTQVTNTVGTYKKVGQWALDNGMKDADVLDASSGLGLGSIAMREMGLKVDDVEPFPASTRKEAPTFSSYEDIDKQYDLVISNAVLNVIPDDWRENVMKQMAAVVKPGGKLFINTRSKPEALNTKKKIELDDEFELLVLNQDGSYRHYQKFSDVPELINWAKMQLGPGWKVEKATKKNIGFSNACSILCTKLDDSPKNRKGDLFADAEEILDIRNKEYGTGETLSTDPDVEIMRNEVNYTREDYEKRLMSELHQQSEIWHDYAKSVETAQELIEKQLGRKLYASENAYNFENQMHSMNMVEVDDFNNNYYAPLLKECADLRKAGVSLADLEDYMIAKSGLERNVVLAERDADRMLPEAFEKAKAKVQEQIDEYESKLAALSVLPSPTPAEKAWMTRYPALISNLKAYNGSNKHKDDVRGALLSKLRKKDYSGLTSLTGYDEVADAEDAAQDMADKMEKAHDMTNFWALVNRATKFGLDKTYDVGRISQETYDRVSTMMQYYIPLRGWREDTAEDVYSYENNMRKSIMPALKSAKGRRSLAESPLAVIGAMGENAVVQGNKNLLYQHVLNLAQHAKTDLFSVSQLYVKRNELTDEWEAVFPNMSNVNDDAVKSVLDDWDAQMRNNIANDPDNWAVALERPNIGYRISKHNLPEHQMIAYRNGKPYVITVNGNPRFAKALKGDMRHSKANGDFYRSMSHLTKTMSKMFTTYSPQFLFNNPFRDIQTSLINNAIREGIGYAAGFGKHWVSNLFKIRGLYHRYADGKLDTSNPTDKYFKEFIENGGQTGFAIELGVAGKRKQLEDTYYKYTGKHVEHPMTELERSNAVKRATWFAKRGFHKTAEAIHASHIDWLASPVKVPVSVIVSMIEDANKYLENLTRFSTYQQSRIVGKSIQDAIRDAKEITGNYNRHGAGGTMAKETTASWFTKGSAKFAQFEFAAMPFLNAAIQSFDTTFGQNMSRKGGKPKLLKAAIGFAGFAGLVAYLWGLMSDEDYYDIPEYERRNKLCIPIGDKQYLSVPLGYQFRSFWALGDIISEMFVGKTDKSASDYSKELTHAFVSLLPIYFLEGDSPDENSNMLGATAKKLLVPGVIKPIWEAATNRKWNGGKVYNDSPYKEKAPGYMKGFNTTDPDIVEFTRWAYKSTRENKLGAKGSVDLNPAVIEYLMESYLGGPIKEVMRSKRFVESTMDADQAFKMRNVPMIGNFFREIDTSRGGRKDVTAWYKNRDYAKRVELDYKELSADEKKQYATSPEYRWYQKWHRYELAYNRLSSAYKKTEDEELRKKMNDLMKQMNEMTRNELGD